MKNLWKTFCLDLGEHETKIIVYVKKEMIQLKDEKKNTSWAKVYYMCKNRFSTDTDNEKYHKVRDNFDFTEKYRGTGRNICNLR